MADDEELAARNAELLAVVAEQAALIGELIAKLRLQAGSFQAAEELCTGCWADRLVAEHGQR